MITRERSDWQLLDWDSSDEARRATAWQSPASMAVKNEYLIENVYKDTHDEKIGSICDGRPSFRHFFHMSFVSLF